MKAVVDKETCVGCGLCAGMEPSVFEMGDDGLAEVTGKVTNENKETVKEAETSCPVNAISYEE